MICKCSREFSFQLYVSFNKSQKTMTEVGYYVWWRQVQRTTVARKHGWKKWKTLEVCNKSRALYPYLCHQNVTTWFRNTSCTEINWCDVSIEPVILSVVHRSFDVHGLFLESHEKLLIESKCISQETKTCCTEFWKQTRCV